MTIISGPTRSDDCRLLAMLQMRDDGIGTKEIGAAFGVTKNAVIGALNRVELDFKASEAAQ